jgi:hypothetical protein
MIAALLIALVVLYFRKLRSKLADRIIVALLFGAAVVFLIAASRLFFYVAIPGLVFVVLLILSRMRELEQRSTILVRELALLRADAERRATRT